MIMSDSSPKKELRALIDNIPDSATYDDIMYELYVRMKISEGKKAVSEGRITSHEEVKIKFMG